MFRKLFNTIILWGLYFQQEGMIFKPKKNSDGFVIEPLQPAANYGLKGVKDVAIATADGLELKAWYHAAEQGRPTFLFLPGNTGHIADVGASLHADGSVNDDQILQRYRIEIMKEILKDGHGVLAITYRGYAGNVGVPSEEGLVMDAQAGLRYLRAQGVSEEELIVCGESLGGGVAISLVATMEEKGHSPALLLCSATFASIADKGQALYPNITLEEFNRYLKHPFNSRETITRIQSTPIILVHGDADDVTPHSHSETLAEVAKHAGAAISLEIVSGAGHITIPPEKILGPALEKYKEQSRSNA